MANREDIPNTNTNKPTYTNSQGKTYLFFIAIDKYKNRVPVLSNAVRDAQVVAECLLEYYDLDPGHLKILVNEQVSRKTILIAFKEYLKKLNDTDNFILYFSGHGSYDKTMQRGYWLTSEAEAEDETTFLSNNTVHDFIKNLKARHVFVMVDACYSEALFLDRQKSLPPSKRYIIPSRWLLTAGRMEPVSDGPTGQHSPFAKALLVQLRSNQDSFLWIGDLCRAVIKGVEANVKGQTPRGQALLHVGDYGGEFAFSRKGVGPPPMNTLETNQNGSIQIQIENEHFNMSLNKELEKHSNAAASPPPPATDKNTESINNLKEEIKNLIAKNKMDGAILLLLKLPLTEEDANEASLYSREWASIERKNRLGFIDPEIFEQKTRIITDNVLKFLSAL